MVGKEQRKRLSITVSTGDGSGTITNQWDIARWVRVVPPNELVTYNLTIADADGYMMINREDQLGTFSERLEISLGIARTVTISRATEDGTFVCLFDIH